MIAVKGYINVYFPQMGTNRVPRTLGVIMGILNAEDKAARDEELTKARLYNQAKERRLAKEAELKREAEAEALHAAFVEIVDELIKEVKRNFRAGKEPKATIRCYLGGRKGMHQTIADAFHAVDSYDMRDAHSQLVADINAIVELYDTDFVAVLRTKHDQIIDRNDGPVGLTYVGVEITLTHKSTES